MNFALIAEKRNKLGLSQKELADKAGVSQSTISRIESGKMMDSDGIQLKKIITALNLKQEDIHPQKQSQYSPRPILAENDSRSEELMKIGVGYCAWAAPVMCRMAEKGGLPGAILTTYSIKDEREESEKPYFYNFEQVIKDKEKVMLPPINDSRVRKNGSTLSKLRTRQHSYWDTDKELRFYNAQSLMNMVEGGELDGVFVPGDLYTDYTRSKITPVARILHTVKGGCLLSVIAPKDIIKVLELDKNSELSDKLTAYTTADSKFFTKLQDLIDQKSTFSPGSFQIIYPSNTVAETHYVEYIHKVIKNRLDLKFQFEQLDIDNDSFLAENIEDTFRQLEELNEIPILFYLAWEPQISYLDGILEQVNDNLSLKDPLQARHIELFDTQDDKSFLFLSFDFFLSNSKVKRWINHPSLQFFLTDLQESVAQITSQRNNLFLERSGQHLSRILRTSPDASTEILKGLNFDFMFHTQWIRELRLANKSSIY